MAHCRSWQTTIKAAQAIWQITMRVPEPVKHLSITDLWKPSLKVTRKAYWQWRVLSPVVRVEKNAPTVNLGVHQISMTESSGSQTAEKGWEASEWSCVESNSSSPYSAQETHYHWTVCDKVLNYIKPSGKYATIEITGALKRLKLNLHKAAGPDKIRPNVLRELAEVIAPPPSLESIASFKQGKTPDIWKEANVTPVFKKG